VQKATELGVRSIVPLLTARSEVKPSSDSTERKLTRWRRIALEAVKQSERSRLVDILAPKSLVEALQMPADTKYFFAERGNKPIDKADGISASKSQRVSVFIGPEGGWKSEEEEIAVEHGSRIVTIGPRILRTETAAIAAISLVQYLFGDLS
jgi:16S rRNA (uracil1498-N3)-methyltransferase